VGLRVAIFGLAIFGLGASVLSAQNATAADLYMRGRRAERGDELLVGELGGELDVCPPGLIPMGPFYDATSELARNEEKLPTCTPFEGDESEGSWSLHRWSIQDNLAAPKQWHRALDFLKQMAKVELSPKFPTLLFRYSLKIPAGFDRSADDALEWIGNSAAMEGQEAGTCGITMPIIRSAVISRV
jgi:hypothetical protein